MINYCKKRFTYLDVYSGEMLEFNIIEELMGFVIELSLAKHPCYIYDNNQFLDNRPIVRARNAARLVNKFDKFLNKEFN